MTIAEKIGVPALLDMLDDRCIHLAIAADDLKEIVEFDQSTEEDRAAAEYDLLDKAADLRMILRELDRAGVASMDGKMVDQKQRELEEGIGCA